MLDDFLSLFFPRICVACENALVKQEKWLCISCDYKMAKAEITLDNKGFLAEKFYGRLHVKHAWTYYLFNKHARIQQLLHKMKYHNMPELAEMVGDKLGLALKNISPIPQIDAIIPIPLHKSKLRRRGYNQSEHFALGLANHFNCKVLSDCIFRTKNTETQTRKSRVRRWENVNDIFQLRDEQAIKNKNVLLVDDVITTGATMEACGEVLWDAGLASLSIAAMAAAK